ncbi:hypothetical protein RRSWK_02815 [Rhodopirellula sp. SWK7]|nr:hypothetical protein RRSWK_02815 [Rhodopirellula sp. SWK7]
MCNVTIGRFDVITERDRPGVSELAEALCMPVRGLSGRTDSRRAVPCADMPLGTVCFCAAHIPF